MEQKNIINENSSTTSVQNAAVSQEDMAMAFGGPAQNEPGLKNDKKKWLIPLGIGIAGLVGGIGCLVAGLVITTQNQNEVVFPQIPSKTETNQVFSDLTGEILTDTSLKNAPTYCIQTPNGTDGARPQAGLTQAGVVFEAIAEAGITRFAAIYQNPTSAIIGPIRSLRTYYLEWDTPFDCTIVHAGGAADALAAVSAGGYSNLDENYSYMYRGTYSGRLWNNLFTTASYLKQFSADTNKNASNVQGFARMTPVESNKSKVDNLAKEKLNIVKATKNNTSELNGTTDKVALNFGSHDSFNVTYTYDATTNTYLRGYNNGDAHEVYRCGEDNLGEKNPEDVCVLTQMSPSVVVAMMVQEKRAADNYHEDITAIGSGEAYIFQNGTAVKGTWTKSASEAQIEFKDQNGTEIKLAPGQTFVSAVPNYGSVDF